MVRSNGRNKGGGKRKIQNVRIADDAAGEDGLKIDRMISQLQTSESQVRVLCGATYDTNATTTAATYTLSFGDIFATDDFTSMLAQYELFRVTAIKFDIYDVNPSLAANNNWSTFHNDTLNTPAYTRAQVADGPDSRVLSSGTGQTTLYWRAHGVEENRFQTTVTTSPAAPIQFFGGLRYYVIGAATGSKYQIVMHAVVDFRGRL